MKQLAKGGHKGAIAWFEEKAGQGDPNAQKYFGKLLETGVQILQNMPKAVELYQKAANQGNRSAQRRLDDFKQAHLFEVLGIKESELSKKVSAKKKILNEVLPIEKEISKKGIIIASNSEESKLPNNLENSIQNLVFSEKHDEQETQQAIENQEVLNRLKTNNLISAAEQNIEDGHYKIAKHLDEVLQKELAIQDDFKLAASLEKSSPLSSSQIASRFSEIPLDSSRSVSQEKK